MSGLYPFTYVLPGFVLSSLKGLGCTFFYFLSALGTIRILAVRLQFKSSLSVMPELSNVPWWKGPQRRASAVSIESASRVGVHVQGGAGHWFSDVICQRPRHTPSPQGKDWSGTEK